jgi:hypothetical protein
MINDLERRIWRTLKRCSQSQYLNLLVEREVREKPKSVIPYSEIIMVAEEVLLAASAKKEAE